MSHMAKVSEILKVDGSKGVGLVIIKMTNTQTGLILYEFQQFLVSANRK